MNPMLNHRNKLINQNFDDHHSLSSPQLLFCLICCLERVILITVEAVELFITCDSSNVRTCPQKPLLPTLFNLFLPFFSSVSLLTLSLPCHPFYMIPFSLKFLYARYHSPFIITSSLKPWNFPSHPFVSAMESQLQENQNLRGNESAKTSRDSHPSRVSSTRWSPTTEQIKLLKELYHINGLRSPTPDQIHAISARLRTYGKVDAKNVFYWFQNHKARERLRNKITPTFSATHCHTNTSIQKHVQDATQQKQYPGGVHHHRSTGVVSDGVQSVGAFGHATVVMENNVRDFSILETGLLNVEDVKPNLPARFSASYSNLVDKISANEEDDDEAAKTKTLALFPMHSEDHHDHDVVAADIYAMKTGSDGYYCGGWWWAHGSGANTSLELSLKSYRYGCHPTNL